MRRIDIPVELKAPPRVLVLFPRTSYRAGAFVEAAHRLGVDLVVGTDHRQALADLVLDRSLPLNLYRPGEALQRIEQAHRSRPFQAILGVDEPTVYLAALACERLGLASNSPRSTRICWLKHLLREQLTRAGLPQPTFLTLDVRETERSTRTTVPFPLVVKPVFLSASRGVVRVNNEAELAAALATLQSILTNPEVRKKNREYADLVLLESYIPGEEVALEGILRDGRLEVLALFDKPDALEGPYFAETIYVAPSRKEREVQEGVIRTVQEAVRAVGLERGPVHAELRINGQGIWLIELAARSIGGRCSQVLQFQNNRMLEEVLLLDALGMAQEQPKLAWPAVGVYMIPVPARGILKAVEQIGEAERVPGVEEVLITVAREQPVAPLPEGDRYLGFIFARGEDPAQVERALREAHARLRIHIVPLG